MKNDELEKSVVLHDTDGNLISIKIEKQKLINEEKIVWVVSVKNKKDFISFVLSPIYFLKLVSFFSRR